MRTGVPVPAGFCVTTTVYKQLVDNQAIVEQIERLDDVDPTDTETLQVRSAELRDSIRSRKLSDDIQEAIETQVHADTLYVASSSATAEDLPTASFAGQHSTVLDLDNATDVTEAVMECMASLFTDRAVAYRAANDIPHEEVSMAIVVQEMVNADSSGVLFTADPTTGKWTVAAIDAATGLGEAVVSGTLTADHLRVDRQRGEIIDYQVGRPDRDGSSTAHTERVLTDEQVAMLVSYGDGIITRR